MTKEKLIAFETDIGETFNRGQIRAPFTYIMAMKIKL